MDELARILEKAWAEEPEPVARIEENQREQEKERKILFLGKKEVVPVRSVLYRNEEFFIEANGSSFIIRPRYEREYLKIRGKRGNKRYVKFTKVAKEILVPMPIVRENPILWFEQNYLSNAKRNMQGAFIRKVWKHREEFMELLCMG